MKKRMAIVSLFAILCISWQSQRRMVKDKNWKHLEAMLRSGTIPGDPGIRLDGVYCWVDSETLKQDPRAQYLLPIGFYANGLIRVDQTVYHDSQSLSYWCSMITNVPDRNYASFGAYRLSHDTIDCYVFTGFAGVSRSVRTFIAHYTGLLKHGDTITGWRMIPPYPKVRTDLNDMSDYTGARMYVFRPAPGCRIETDKIWMNRYRRPDTVK